MIRSGRRVLSLRRVMSWQWRHSAGGFLEGFGRYSYHLQPERGLELSLNVK